jgi:8-oxo-dGTP pyrophosphatase MutT (NUDIX family)
LHRHRRLGIWLQPGGHLDPGETPWEAAVREASEETGLPLRHPLAGPRLVHVDVHPAAAGHVHLDLRYLVETSDHEPRPPPGESQEVRWFAWPEALALADEGLAGALWKLASLSGIAEHLQTLRPLATRAKP